MTAAGLNIVPIDDPADERIADYANLADAELAHRLGGPAGGLFMAEGELVVGRLAASGYRTRSVLVTPTRLRTIGPALAGLPAGTPIYLADQAAMDRIAGFSMHRGVLACAERGPDRDAGTISSAARGLVVLEDLANHDNLGGVFRNVAALCPGPVGVLLSPRCADPLYRKALRVSMGHVLTVPFARARSWPAALSDLSDQGFEVIAMVAAPSAPPLGEVACRLLRRGSGGARSGHSPRWALVLGAEGPGLSEPARSAAAHRATIPMAAGVDSLNVAVAAAVGLYELARPDPTARPEDAD